MIKDKKDKGFTLIELLAVIVILAIISLIATPIILNIIGSIKEETIIKSGELYLRAVKNAIASENLTHEFNPSECEVTEDGNLNCNGEKIIIETNGNKPSGGYIELEEGEITNVEELLLGEYNLETDDNKKLVIVKLNDEKKCKVRYATTTPNKPDLINNTLTPIKYDGNNWVITTSNDSSWYNYAKQEWANAVILSDAGKSKTSPGTILDISTDVTAMLVWIPRYEYRIEGEYGKCGESADLPGAIDIKFVEISKKEADKQYIMHPAFNFGGEELTGIWVGKFETSTKVGSVCYDSSSYANCDNTDQEPYILPNVYSLRAQKVSNQFETAKKFNTTLGSKGDSHMMKNVEWGAVAYLSQSKYGKYGKDGEEVYINNCSKYITGIAGDSVNAEKSDICTNTYETGKGQKASTTGNITGVYDMSGGALEYVMGYLTTAYKNTWGASIFLDTELDWAKFTSEPEGKYFDAYTDKISTSACNGDICYGQALSETEGWYGNNSAFVSKTYPWFSRGGVDGSSDTGDTGLFAYDCTFGLYDNNGTFRIVFAPTT